MKVSDLMDDLEQADNFGGKRQSYGSGTGVEKLMDSANEPTVATGATGPLFERG